MVATSQMKLGDYFFYTVIFLLITLPYIYKKFNSIVYFGKYIAYGLVSSIIATGCIPLFIFNARNVKNCLVISDIAKHLTNVVGIRWDLRNLEHVSEDRGAIIVSNHQSIFDILGMYCYWHIMDKCAAVAKKELFYFWPFGLAAWLGGVVFIDRSKGPESYSILYKTAQLMEMEKTKIFIFPEGTRNTNANRTLQFLPFKKGAFRMAITCKVPILPLVYSPYYFIDRSTHYFGSGKVIVKGLPPISTENLTENDIQSLMDKTQEIMAKTYDELCDEVLSTLPENHFTRQAFMSKMKAQ